MAQGHSIFGFLVPDVNHRPGLGLAKASCVACHVPCVLNKELKQ